MNKKDSVFPLQTHQTININLDGIDNKNQQKRQNKEHDKILSNTSMKTNHLKVNETDEESSLMNKT